MEEKREEEQGDNHTGGGNPFPLLAKVQKKEGYDNSAKSQTIRTIRVVVDLEAHQIELYSHPRRQKHQQQHILPEQAQAHQTRHVGNSQVLQRDTEKIAFQIGTRAPTDTVVDLENNSNTAQENIGDAPYTGLRDPQGPATFSIRHGTDSNLSFTG
jgi:hypothetical protein